MTISPEDLHLNVHPSNSKEEIEINGNELNLLPLPPGTITRQEHENALAQARAKELRLERQLSQFRAVRQDDVLHSAISAWAIDPELVIKMTQSDFAMDESGQIYPVDAEGAVLLDKDGQAITMEHYFQRFRKEKPYLVKASISRGAGSQSEAGSAASALPPSMAQMAELPMAQFIKAGGLKSKK